MKIQLSIVGLLVWFLLTLTATSCHNNTSPSGSITVGIQGNGTGCTIISYVNGGSAVTYTGNGSYTNYSNLANGNYSVSIYAVSLNSGGTCDFTINNNNHTVGVNSPCTGGSQLITCD